MLPSKICLRLLLGFDGAETDGFDAHEDFGRSRLWCFCRSNL